MFDLMVRRLSRTLPDALRPRSHRLTDPCVRETIPEEVIQLQLVLPGQKVVNLDRGNRVFLE